MTHSVHQKGRGFTVAASPLNQVKLELGVVLCLAVMLLLLVHSLGISLLSQIVILLAFGMAAGAWIIYRVRQTVSKLPVSEGEANGEERK